MELQLRRTYHPKGTNGGLFHGNDQVCNAIELPDHKNISLISCIPEGRYELSKRYSQKFEWHIQVLNVPDRVLILVHAANNALTELEGCIAPVTTLTGEGLGSDSRKALSKVKELVYEAIDQGDKVYLTIVNSEHIIEPLKTEPMKIPSNMNIIERVAAPTPPFFKSIRNVGLTITAVSGAVIAAPIALPALLVSIAGYVALAGGIMSAISQVAVKAE